MNKKNNSLIPFLLLVLVNVFWLISSWPMSMSPDSLDVWEQVKNGVYRNDHPVTYTIFVKIFSLGGNFLPLVSAVQLMLLSAGILFACFTILRNFPVSMFITSIIMLAPTAGALATTLWKDVPFTSLILIGSSLVVKNFNFIGVIFLSIGASFRHNGWLLLLTIAILIALLLIFRNNLLKRYLWILITASTASFLIIIMSAKLMDAKPASTWLTWSPALADLAYIASRTPNDASEIHETVALFSTGDSLTRSADCTSINGMVFSDGFKKNNLDKHLGKILQEFLTLVRSNPQLILRLHLCRAQAFIPPPISSGPSYFYWTQMIIIEPNDFKLTPNPPFPFIRELGLKIWGLWDSDLKLLLWPGLVTLISSFAFLINIKSRLKQRGEIWTFWIIAMWGALFSIIPWSAAQDFRYALFSYLIAQIFILVTILEIFQSRKLKTLMG